MIRPVAPLLAIALVLVLAPPRPARADDAPPTPEQLAARERIRPRFEAILKDIHTPWKPGEEHPNYFTDVTDAMIALGPDGVPFLAAELDLMDSSTYHFCAYALGRLGGPEAEAALRKALRRSEERGGPFGAAAKRFALVGLALNGDADVVDEVQRGLAIQGAVQLPDLPLIAHLAMVTAPASISILVSQLDKFSGVPAELESLRWTLLALAHVGDASLLPKLLPLLDRPDAGVRGQAAEAIARIAPPSACDALIAKLGDPHVKTDYAIVTALERLDPRPCGKDLLARLEFEQNLEVRAGLYRMIASIEGEAALEVLRSGYLRGGNAERAIVLNVVGRLGSKKGLGLVRAALPEKDLGVVLAAIDALSRIGGESADDTLLALTSDPRRPVVVASVRYLADAGERRAGPRVAERLLEILREPIGDLTLRPAVRELSEALVILEFTEPAEDLKAAAARQTDAEIRGHVEACVRGLLRLKTNGVDVARWSADLADGDAELRRLAAARLAEIASAESLRALDARLLRADLKPDDRVTILRAIARARTKGAEAIVERHLAEPAFDAYEARGARQEAAWAARRLGGERMVSALRASALRRDGRDWATLVALAVLDPEHAAPVLSPLRFRRLRYADPRFGVEDAQLDEILALLRSHRAPARFDVPPEALFEM